MELTAENVNKVFMDCLFKDGEDTTTHVAVEGIVTNVGFNPTRLDSHKQDIADMLDMLPDSFKQSGGGGMTFLNACMDNNDIQWGEHRDMEQLVLLGIATKKAKFLMPRDMWQVCPGGMPYFVVM